MWTLLLAFALAAPLPVTATVRLDPVEVRPAPVDVTPREAVTVTPIDVVADGVVESPWVVVAEAPPLTPRELGPAAPADRAHVALASTTLVVLAPLLGKRYAQTWMLDPDGLAQRWWRWRLQDGVVTAERCGFEGVSPERPAVIPSRALPCEPTTLLRSGMGKTGWEIGFPRDGLTTAARLGWSVEGPNRTGGTWGPNGKADGLPEQGRTLALRVPGARVDAVPDPAAGLWHVTVAARKELPGTWSWRVVGGGEVVDAGTVEAEGELVDFDVPWRHRPDTVLEVRPGTAISGLPVVWLRALGDPASRAWLRTPVARDVLELGYLSPVARAGLVVRVTDPKGRVVAELPVDVLAGAGVIRLEGAWPPGVLQITVDGLMDDPASLVVTR